MKNNINLHTQHTQHNHGAFQLPILSTKFGCNSTQAGEGRKGKGGERGEEGKEKGEREGGKGRGKERKKGREKGEDEKKRKGEKGEKGKWKLPIRCEMTE